MTTTVKISFDPCPVCDGCEWSFVRNLDEARKFKLFRCSDCGHIMQNPIPSGEQLAEVYSAGYSVHNPAWKESGWPLWKILRCWTTRRRVSYLKCYGRGSAMLEVGAGAGDFLAAAVKSGWDVKAVEYNAEMCAAINGEFGVDIRQGQLTPDMWPRESFDLVAMWNVIEHLQHPLEDLRIAADYLRPSGRLLLNIPTDQVAHHGKWFGHHWALLLPPEHINFFGGETLAGVAEKAGLRLIVYQTPFVQSCWSYYTACKNWANGNIFLFLASFSIATLGIPYYLYESLNGRGMESFAVLEKI